MGIDLLPVPGGYAVLKEVNGAVEFNAAYSPEGGDVYAALADTLGLLS